ncbi:MAG: FN3 associated domain-containing protein [bacterium]
MKRLAWTLSITLLSILVFNSCTLRFKGPIISQNNNPGGGGGGVDELVVLAPIMNPTAGPVFVGAEIAMSSKTDGASIYYNVGNGAQKDPNETNAILYDPDNKPVINSAAVIKAIAVKKGYSSSEVVSAEFTIATPRPVYAVGHIPSYDSVSVGGLVKLDRYGTLDEAFIANEAIGLYSDVDYFSVAAQEDGKIIAGGHGNYISMDMMARFNADGNLDPSMGGAFGSAIYDAPIAISKDGRVVIQALLSGSHGRLSAFDTDGTRDLVTFTDFNTDVGAGNRINSIKFQDDGKILIAGQFGSYAAVVRNNIARLNTDGTVDDSFNVGSGTDDYIDAVAVQDDGKVLIAGNFTLYKGVPVGRIVRLNTNGSIDTSFDAGSGASDYITSIAVQSDGKILIAGNFVLYNGVDAIRIARLNSDGSLDDTFASGLGPDNVINAIALQSNRSILICGAFGSYDGASIGIVASLNSDGTLDGAFLSAPKDADSECYSIAVGF